MRCKSIVFLAVVLLMTGFASANTVWNAVDSNDIAAGYADWGVADNWTLGIPGTVAPADTKAVFNVPAAVECRVTDAQICKDLVMGDGGAAVAPEDNLLRIMPGGTLTTTGGWMAVGYNRPAKLVVEEGGEYHHAGHFWWGMRNGGDGIVDINGGFVTNDGSFGLGEYFGPEHGQCKVYIRNGGELNIHHWTGGLTSSNPVFWNDSLIDIGRGKMVIRNDSEAEANEYIAAGKIVGYGGLTTPVAVFADGVTTITAPHPLAPSPSIGEVVVLNGTTNEVTLSWTNLDPNTPGDDVYVDVWFGIDPNKAAGAAFYEKKLPASTDTSVTITGLGSETYYWQVDSYIMGAGNINDANMIEGDVFTFDAVLDGAPAIVIDTPDTLTWAGEPVTLTATVTDDLQSASTVVWSDPTGDDGDPNIIYTNESYSYPTATVTVTSDSHQPNTTITATVSDGNPLGLTGSDTVLVDFAESACQGAGGGFMHLWEVYSADFDRNCIVNLADFAVIAEEWMTDFKLTGPVPIQ